VSVMGVTELSFYLVSLKVLSQGDIAQVRPVDEGVNCVTCGLYLAILPESQNRPTSPSKSVGLLLCSR
jgi:hypothetical protein